MKIDYFKVRNMSILNLVTNKILNAKYFSTYLMLKSQEIDDIFIQFHYFLTWDPQHNTKITNIAMVAAHWLTVRGATCSPHRGLSATATNADLRPRLGHPITPCPQTGGPWWGRILYVHFLSRL